MMWWTKITHFGDVAITASVALAIAGWLLVEDEKRLTLWWCLLFSAGMGVVIATKMAFIGWGICVRSLDFTGFSGHTMRSAAVMPVLFYLLVQKMPSGARLAGALLGLAFGAVVGVSRVAVHAHSVSEVVAGWFLGTAVSVAFLWLANTSLRAHVFKPFRTALVILALLPAPYVHPTPTQKWLTEFTLYFSGQERAFPRSEWRHAREL
jgi:membrane-associated phospholipid phosphatase